MGDELEKKVLSEEKKPLVYEICFHHFFGRCSGCRKNYDGGPPYNRSSCEKYSPIKMNDYRR